MAYIVTNKRTHPHEDESSLDTARGSFRTVSARQPKHLSFSNRLTLAFTATAVMTVFVLIMVLSNVWETQFKRYTQSNMEKLATATASNLAYWYNEDIKWSPATVKQSVDAYGYSGDIYIRVFDEHENLIYDETLVTEGSVEDNQTSHATSKNKRLLTPETAENFVSAPILLGTGKKVGVVQISSFGSDALLSKSDVAFRTNSYNAIWVAAFIAVVLASVIGFITSRMLAMPIKRITATADALRKGELHARTNLLGDDEIGKLGQTFDSMANSLEKDIKMERRITLDVAHELRTPLMAMQATIEALQDGIYPLDTKYLGRVANEIERLTRLVNALMQLSRMESGSQKPKFKEVDIVQMVQELTSSQERLFEDKGLLLKFKDETRTHACLVQVDPDMLSQAVINLLSNAMRYTAQGGWVVVSVACTKEEVLITVEDTGIGIAKDEVAKVFSRFWRSDASRERESGGLGVGLSVTKEIIERHHGFIAIDSELNKGTAFTLHIPRTLQSE